MTRRTWTQIGRNLLDRIPLFRSRSGQPTVVTTSAVGDGSADYWERRYAAGGDSGPGCTGRLARFKADVVNDFVRQDSVRTVIELGCGDGNQLSLMNFPNYTGVDVSHTALAACRGQLSDRENWRFVDLAEIDALTEPFDLALSLDVIRYLAEDAVFEAHMAQLFTLSNRFVMVYSTNHDEETMDAQVRHRRFTDWVSANGPGWIQISHVANPYPADDEDPENTSDADFFIFARHTA